MTYPGIGLHPVIPHETLTGKPLVNGQLGPCDLVQVYLPGVGLGALHPFAKRAWDVMAIICHLETGYSLTATSMGDIYRSLHLQDVLFHQRYTTTYDPAVTSGVFKMFDGQKYYQRIGVATAATPGSSNHGFGIAIDAAIWTGSKVLGLGGISKVANWMIAQAGTFGWTWELQSEFWHVRHMAGDGVVQRVLEVEAFLAASAVAA